MKVGSSVRASGTFNLKVSDVLTSKTKEHLGLDDDSPSHYPLPHLTYWNLMRFCATPNFRVTFVSSPFYRVQCTLAFNFFLFNYHCHHPDRPSHNASLYPVGGLCRNNSGLLFSSWDSEHVLANGTSRFILGNRNWSLWYKSLLYKTVKCKPPLVRCWQTSSCPSRAILLLNLLFVFALCIGYRSSIDSNHLPHESVGRKLEPFLLVYAPLIRMVVTQCSATASIIADNTWIFTLVSIRRTFLPACLRPYSLVWLLRLSTWSWRIGCCSSIWFFETSPIFWKIASVAYFGTNGIPSKWRLYMHLFHNAECLHGPEYFQRHT